jgi:hypothetical protein
MQPFNISFGNPGEMPQGVVEPEIEDVEETVEEIEEEIVTEVPEQVVTSTETATEDSGEGEDTGEPVYANGKTGSALLAEYYKNTGLLPDDFEVKDNLSADELAKAVEDNVGARKAQEIEDEYRSKGYDEKLLTYAEIIAQGGNPETLQVHAQYDILANYETSDTDEMKKIVTYMYQDKGLKEKEINRIVENADYDDELEDLYKEARGYFSDKRDTYLGEVRDSLERQKKEEEKILKQRQDAFRNTIRKKALGELSITDTEAKKFEKDFMEPTERHIVQNPDGTTTPMKITKYQKRLMEIQEDPEKTLEVAYYIMYGFKPIKEKAKSEAQNELDKLLKPQETLRTVRTQEKQNAVVAPTGKPLFTF